MTLISAIHVDVVSLLEEVTDQILNTYFTTSCKTSFCFFVLSNIDVEFLSLLISFPPNTQK